MNNEQFKFLGYCGAYCKSCVFFTELISKESNFLSFLISSVNLNKWYKPVTFKWEDAENFLKELEEGKFNCKSCRIGPSWKECPVYLCVEERKLNGCWECREFPCGKLKELWKGHPQYLEKFVNTIKSGGTEKWIEYLEELYREGKDFLGRKIYKKR